MCLIREILHYGICGIVDRENELDHSYVTMTFQRVLYFHIERSDGSSDPETQTGIFFSLGLYSKMLPECLSPSRCWPKTLCNASRVTRRVLTASCLQTRKLATCASEMTTVRLYPPLFEEGKSAEFLRTGRTLSVTQSPRDNSVAVYATNTAVG